jgi:hypothetical protein
MRRNGSASQRVRGRQAGTALIEPADHSRQSPVRQRLTRPPTGQPPGDQAGDDAGRGGEEQRAAGRGCWSAHAVRREAWPPPYAAALLQRALQAAMDAGAIAAQPVVPLAHVLIGALDECARYVARAEDPVTARQEKTSFSALAEGSTVRGWQLSTTRLCWP